MNRKILVRGYFNNNFGDDLFLYILVNRYPEYHFDILANNFEQIKAFRKYKNIGIITIDKLKETIDEYCTFIQIGGSMFQEVKYWWIIYYELWSIVRLFKKKRKPVQIIGFNFGPFRTNLFKKLYRNLLLKSDYISPRDLQTISDLNLKDTNWWPDIVFNLKNIKNRIDNTSQKTIGISVIDIPNDNKKNEINKIIEKIIKISDNNNLRIRLFSFQEGLGVSDYAQCLNILKKFPDLEIDIVRYDGNIESFLNEFSICDYFLDTRFHSMILSILFGQKLLAINYDNKIKNTIQTLELPFNHVSELQDLQKFSNINLMDEYFLNIEPEILKQISTKAEYHFSYMDWIDSHESIKDI